MSSLLLKNATIVDCGFSFKGSVYVEDDRIVDVLNYSSVEAETKESEYAAKSEEVIDLTGLYLAPGIIDTHVHFREPGASEKATIVSESAAAALGGVTSYFDMPNNNPFIDNRALLADKFLQASKDSTVNYSFYLGCTTDNLDEIVRLDPKTVCGVKVFLGASTGNMVLDDPSIIDQVFLKSPVPIVAHCEDNSILETNLKKAKEQYGDHIPFTKHPDIRSREACIKATTTAIRSAIKNDTRLHVAHVSTSEEVMILKTAHSKYPRITGEACVGYLYYDDSIYARRGVLLKCNPSIKTAADRKAIRKGVRKGFISTISSDHAPHLLSEKMSPYISSPSGTPYVQFSFLMMLELVHKKVFQLETIVERMTNAPARVFNIEKRGFLKPGYFADMVVFDFNTKSTPPIAYKCGWSPITSFSSSILHTISNGVFVVRNGELTGKRSGKKITFNY